MNRTVLRGTAALAVAGIAMGAGQSGAAYADTVLNLGTASVSQKVGGATVTISISNHSGRLSPGMVSLPTTRNAWVSGVVSAKIDGEKASGGSIMAGYVVGCQVDVGAASVKLSGGVDSGVGYDSSADSPFSFTPKATASTGGSLSLKAGSVGTQMLTYDRSKWPAPGDEITPKFAEPGSSFKFAGKSGSLAYSDQTIGVDGCAGYAQAKFFAKVKALVGNSEGTVLLWGKPFSLG
ncbi:MspA family porin [Tsukamurella pseudospumae]|uniref:MspA family protein n=1 Tax=Tsukamurella pseudospumae TaxID=239498 RepID=A0A137YT21_9ACTN|nr:MspA family porin [Tsukamurella pseudospumae]KXO89144.1 hypothetical protein AXK61_11050 [Tsukamurella pseudospumae]